MKKILFSIALFFAAVNLCAQSANTSATGNPGERQLSVSLVARSYGDSIVLRWAPDDPALWLLASQEGWTITRSGGSGKNSYTAFNNGRPVKAWPLAQFQSSFQGNPYASVMAQMLYGKSSVPQSLSDKASTLARFIKQYSGEQHQRQLIASLVADLSPRVAEAAALRFVDRNVQKGVTYQYTISTSLDRQLVSYQASSILVECTPFDSSALASIQPPQVKQTDASHVVVYWPRTAHSAYMLERSSDDGSSWKSVSDLPILNLRNANPTASSSLLAQLAADNVLFLDSLPLGQSVSYRVRGIDAFSDLSRWAKSEPFSLTDQVPPVAPYLYSAFMIGDTVMQLSFSPSTSPDCKNLVVAFAKETSGPWTQISGLLSPDTTSFIDSSASSRLAGYYRVYAIDSSNNIAYSNVLPVSVADFSSPAAPADLNARATKIMANIDGRRTPSGLAAVTLSWSPSSSKDVLAYRVFSANQRDHQFIEASQSNIYSTSFSDTLNIQTTTQHIYYYVVTIDNRYNYSVPSDTVQLDLPDIVPPTACAFDTTILSSNSAVVRWHKSSSSDVDRYIIYCQPKNTNRWQHLATVSASSVADSASVSYSLSSSDLEKSSQFSIEAIDKSGNSVGRAAYVTVSQLSATAAAPQIPISLSAKYNKKASTIDLRWNYSYSGKHYGILYRSVNGQKAVPVTTVSSDQTTFSDIDVPASAKVSYHLLLKLSNGTTTQPSNTVTVTTK